MQIIKANEDIAAISVCASVCVCVSANKNKSNILMTFGQGGLCREVLPVPPSLWAIILLSPLKKLRNSLSPHSCQANSAAVY